MLVRFHSEADVEAQAAHDFYANDSSDQGARFEAALQRVIETIQRYPASGHPVIRGIRRKLIRAFHYSVVYKILPDHVLILAVAHYKQQWGYWLNRLD